MLFSRCERLTDGALRYVGEGLKKSRELEELNLNIGRSGWITYEGVENLSESFFALKKLRSLELNFEEYRNILLKIVELD